MQQTGWYVIAYDITDTPRRQRLHRRLRVDGLALQQSVFLVQQSRRGIERLMDELSRLIDRREDDLRAYPITAPTALWLHGDDAIADGLRATGAAPRVDKSGKSASRPLRRGWWRRSADGQRPGGGT